MRKANLWTKGCIAFITKLVEQVTLIPMNVVLLMLGEPLICLRE